MKYLLLLFYLNFCCVNCSILLNVKNKNNVIIPTEIISNYLHKYLKCEEKFLSISSSSDSIQQKYFQEDIISNLIVHAKLKNFTYNILNKIDQSREGNKNVFNLVFVDKSTSIT